MNGTLPRQRASNPSLLVHPPVTNMNITDQGFNSSITYTQVDSVVTIDLGRVEFVQSKGLNERTSLDTLLNRIIDTMTQRNTTITRELIRLNQCIRGSKM